MWKHWLTKPNSYCCWVCLRTCCCWLLLRVLFRLQTKKQTKIKHNLLDQMERLTFLHLFGRKTFFGFHSQVAISSPNYVPMSLVAADARSLESWLKIAWKCALGASLPQCEEYSNIWPNTNIRLFDILVIHFQRNAFRHSFVSFFTTIYYCLLRLLILSEYIWLFVCIQDFTRNITQRKSSSVLVAMAWF